MHALIAAVLLRGWLDALDFAAEPEPSHRQLAAAEERVGASKTNAVIGADGLGQAELSENGLEYREGIGCLGGGERLACEDVSAGEIAAGKGERRSLRPVEPAPFCA